MSNMSNTLLEAFSDSVDSSIIDGSSEKTQKSENMRDSETVRIGE